MVKSSKRRYSGYRVAATVVEGATWLIPIGIAFNLVWLAGTLWYWRFKDWRESKAYEKAIKDFPALGKMFDYFGPTPDHELVAHIADKIREAQIQQGLALARFDLPPCEVGRHRRPGERCIDLSVPPCWIEFAHLVGDHVLSMIEEDLTQWENGLSKWWQLLTVPTEAHLLVELDKLLASPDWAWRRRFMTVDLFDKLETRYRTDKETFRQVQKDYPHVVFVWTHKNRLKLS